MAALCNRAGHYSFAVVSIVFFLSIFFSSPNLSSHSPQIGCLPYFHTWCSLSANLQTFSRTTRVSWCQTKSSSACYSARRNIRGRHTNNPAGRHSIRTNQWPISFIPPFLRRCPSCHSPPNLSWLGTGTKYAGSHTQWLGYPSNRK